MLINIKLETQITFEVTPNDPYIHKVFHICGLVHTI